LKIIGHGKPDNNLVSSCIILPILYGYKSWSFIIKEGAELRGFGDRVLRRTFRQKGRKKTAKSGCIHFRKCYWGGQIKKKVLARSVYHE
jgi:hypothetical protein